MSPLQLSILRALQRYHFLTNRQLHELGLGNVQVIRRTTHVLASTPPKAPLLIRKSFPPHARLGRMAHVFSLGKSGHHQLQHHERHPIPQNIFQPFTSLDYFHRLSVISFQMNLEKALSKLPSTKLLWFHHYFEMIKRNRHFQSRLRLEFLDGGFTIPDSAFFLRLGNQSHLFLLEYVRGYRQQRTLEQIGRHVRLLQVSSIAHQWGIPTPPKILFLFEHASHAVGIRKRLQSKQTAWFMPFADAFLFAPWDAFVTSPLKCWRKVNTSTLHSLFPSAL